MTVTQEIEEEAVQQSKYRAGRFNARYIDIAIAGLLAVATGITRGINLSDYPRFFVDEGVYVSQAWAVTQGQLAPYTYWYDHPPFGWIQIASWSIITGAIPRQTAGSGTIMAGRELMVVVAMVSTALVYLLARRLQMNRWAACTAGLLLCFSPLAATFGRYVLLDNIAVMWVLVSLLLLLHPRRHMVSVAFSAVFLALAALSKETALLFVPAWVLLGWQHYRTSSNKSYAAIVAGSIFALGGSLYPLYAALKDELLPGPGHVSLWDGQIAFQLFNRKGSGSLLDATSGAWGLANDVWLGQDVWLPALGMAALIPAFFVARLRAVATALAIHTALLLRGGYVPFPFIIALLPLLALLTAGMCDTVWSWIVRRQQADDSRWVPVVAILTAGLLLSQMVPQWYHKLAWQFSVNDTRIQTEVVQWVSKNIPRTAQLVAEGEIWLDLALRGFNSPRVIWTYKVDTDPAVRADYAPRGLNYLVLSRQTIRNVADYPTLADAITHASIVASFGVGDGQMLVYEVKK